MKTTDTGDGPKLKSCAVCHVPKLESEFDSGEQACKECCTPDLQRRFHARNANTFRGRRRDRRE